MSEWLIAGAIFGILIVISFFIGWVIGVQMTSKNAAKIIAKKLKENTNEPVRCKDCKWFDPFPMCKLLGTSDNREDFFCADGVKRE